MLAKSCIFFFSLYLLGLGYVESGTDAVGDGYGGLDWYQNLPAVAIDYKITIEAGKEDCYYQFVTAGASFYVSFQVIRGGDGMAGFQVRDPKGTIVKPYEWQTNADYTDSAAIGGYYAVCLDNQFSRFASKLINVYLTVVRYDDWEKFTKEIESLNLNMQNFTTTISSVEKNIFEMFQYQSYARASEARDYALIVDNNAYVQNWSLIQISVILLTTIIQVFFVRKLFDIKNSGYSKSRI